MQFENVLSIESSGTGATEKVEQEVLRPSDSIDIVC